MDTFSLYKKHKYADTFSNAKYAEIRERIVKTFEELEFDEEPHTYHLHGRELLSVTNVTHLFREPFDEEIIAQRTFVKYSNDPRSRYFGKTVEEIKAMWQESTETACANGRIRHSFGEACFWFMAGQNDQIPPQFRDRLTDDGALTAQNPQEIAIAKFWDELPADVMPILCENKVCREDLGYAGTFDLLLYHEGKLAIADYKTNRNLYKHFGSGTLNAPFDDMPEMELSLYTLQQSLYQLALEHIGLEVKELYLVWLKSDGTYQKFNLISRSNLLETYLREHPLFPASPQVTASDDLPC